MSTRTLFLASDSDICLLFVVAHVDLDEDEDVSVGNVERGERKGRWVNSLVILWIITVYQNETNLSPSSAFAALLLEEVSEGAEV